MNYKIIFILLLMSLGYGCQQKENHMSEINESEKVVDDQKLLRHIVLFKFVDTASEEEISKVVKAFQNLPMKIETIRGFEWGINNSPENVNKGFTHCFLLTFHSEEDRAIYLPHPDHKAFGAVLGPILEDVLVVDYWAQ